VIEACLARQKLQDAMRLINTANYKLEEFFDKDVPKYAILSHTWGQNEVILAGYEKRMEEERWNGSADNAVNKIIRSCRLAAEDGYAYVWVDTYVYDLTILRCSLTSIQMLYRQEKQCRGKRSHQLHV
jgi:hypothetical protein